MTLGVGAFSEAPLSGDRALGGGGSSTNVDPGAGTLIITGYAPTISQGVTTNVNPGVGTLTLTGHVPTVAQSANQSVAPLVGTLTLTGYAPTVAQTANQAVAPVVGTLTITGYAPTVTQAPASYSGTPDTGVLTLVGYAPTVTQEAPRSVSGADPEPWQWQTKKKKRTTQERKAVKDDLRETLQEIIQGPAPVVVQVEAKELLVHVEESPKATPAQEQRVERLVMAVQEYTRQRRRRQEEELLLMD